MQLSWLNRSIALPESDPQRLMQAYIQTDNPAYLAQLIHSYGDDLYHFLLKQTDPALAADLSQQSWLKVMEQKQQFAGHSSFKTWLFAIGRQTFCAAFTASPIEPPSKPRPMMATRVIIMPLPRTGCAGKR